MEDNVEPNPAATPFAQTYFHGTKSVMHLGDLLVPGHHSNYMESGTLHHVYMTATLDAAIWGAELAGGAGKERIYLVEPTGNIENDPNLTDKKFPGNPTMAFRSRYPLRVIGEVCLWQPHAPAQVKAMKDALLKLKENGLDEIENENH